jgi:branched-chain amino acid transport system substrate-binding protein
LVSSAAAQESRIRIGVMDDMAGPYAANAGPGVVTAAKMAIEDFGGKVLNRPIDVLQANDQNKIDVGVVVARGWYEKDKVSAIFGISSSSVALGVQEVSRELKKLLVITSAASTELSGKACSPYAVQWNQDAYSVAAVVGNAVLDQGLDSWFFITVDYNFGAALEAGLTGIIKSRGGSVAGAVKHPFGTSDFSSLMLQAQFSGAKVIALANGGEDMNNAIKNAKEFGLMGSAQTVATFFLQGPNIEAIGQDLAAGLINPTSFVPGLSAESKEFSIRFNKLTGQYPTHIHAGVYTAVKHYLGAVQKAGTDETEAVLKAMHELPVNDFMTQGATLRVDGRIMRDMYLVKIKKKKDMTFPLDYFEVLKKVPADQAFLTLAEGGCPLAR